MSEEPSIQRETLPAESEAPAAEIKRGRPPTIFEHPLDFYPGEFQRLLGTASPPVTERAIKRWVQAGRDSVAPELPPMDAPHQLAAWWSRKMKLRVPDWIRELERRNGGGPPVPFDGAAPVAMASAALGIRGTLERVRAAEAAAGALVLSTRARQKAASDAGNFDEYSRWKPIADEAQRQWDGAVERLRTVELAAPKVREANDSTWDAEEVMASFEVLHLALKASILNLRRDDTEWPERVEKVFAGLRNNKFTAAA